MSATAELLIESIAAGGDGVARHDGLVVFVPRTAPGDRALVRYTARGRFARGELLALASPAPGRTDPPCAHYTADRCGGCQLQHLRYEAQLEAKHRIVSDALERIGRRRVTTAGTRPSPRAWRYRRKLTLALRRRGGEWIVGLHPLNAPGHVFPLEDCPITDERIIALWRDVVAAADSLPVAQALRGAVRIDGDGEMPWSSFLLEGGSSWRESGDFFARVSRLAELWWQPEGGRRRRLHHRGLPAVPGAAFAQVNADVAGELTEFVVGEARRRGPATVIDAYAGIGDSAVALDRAGARVTAIELDREASAWCARRLGGRSRAIAARVEDVLDEVLPADLVLLNPPRGGVHERVTAVLSARPAPAIIYVSCSPATLARDVARLPGYAIRLVQPFDMFPQTAHVETVCILERDGGDGAGESAA